MDVKQRTEVDFFLSSTLTDPNKNRLTGKLDTIRLTENMNIAINMINVYIGRLTSTKCSGEEIKYFQ